MIRSCESMVAMTGLEDLTKLEMCLGSKCSSQFWDWWIMALGGALVVVVKCQRLGRGSISGECGSGVIINNSFCYDQPNLVAKMAN